MKWQLETILFIMFSLLLGKKKILLGFQNLLLLAPLPACDVFVSVAFLKAQKDNLRGLIRVGKVFYSNISGRTANLSRALSDLVV